MSAMDHLLSTLEAAVSTGSALSRIDNHEGLQGSTKCSCKNLHFSFAITYIFCLQLSTFLFYNKQAQESNYWLGKYGSDKKVWIGKSDTMTLEMAEARARKMIERGIRVF